jgi:DNA helicase-2/ATP-dependent DNA helicase PcrA
MNLSPKQRAIVEHIYGAALVKADPGSGKTRALAERVKRLLSVNKRGKILVLTISKKAAEEMGSRLKSGPEASAFLERVTVSTIHSFCVELVKSRGYLIGLRPDVSIFESEYDRLAVLRGDLPEGFQRQFSIAKPDLIAVESLLMISERKRALVSPEPGIAGMPLNGIHQAYNIAMANRNAIDCDDILFYSYRILVENIEVAKLYNSVFQFVCVEEAQDLNNAQYRVLQALCGESFRNIMLVGDEKQSLCHFNGSGSKYMSELFIRDFSPAVYSLDGSFRTANRIMEFSNRLTERKDDSSKCFYDGGLLISSHPNEKGEAESVCAQIEKLLKYGHKDIEGIIGYDDFAIIARSKYALSSVEQALSMRGLPFHYKKPQSGIHCETDHMEAFDLILRLLVNPADLHHMQKLCGLASSALPQAEDGEDAAALIFQALSKSRYSWLLEALPSIPSAGPIDFDKALGALKSSMPYHMADEERYLLENDIAEWQRHWNAFKGQAAKGNFSLASFRSAISLGKTQSSSPGFGIVLLNANMSMGLEFEVVFVVGLSEGAFPDWRAANASGEALAQEKAIMLAAVTRAKRLCFLSFSETKRMPWGEDKKQYPSRFIANCDGGSFHKRAMND